ncbi:MAG: hypothetical protein AAB215_02800 [Planctomycetota bacterium]
MAFHRKAGEYVPFPRGEVENANAGTDGMMELLKGIGREGTKPSK